MTAVVAAFLAGSLLVAIPAIPIQFLWAKKIVRSDGLTKHPKPWLAVALVLSLGAYALLAMPLVFGILAANQLLPGRGLAIAGFLCGLVFVTQALTLAVLAVDLKLKFRPGWGNEEQEDPDSPPLER